jgi:multiple antibiotic resistance protein
MTVATVFISLLMILDPFGNIPIFLSQLRHLSAPRRRVVIFREMAIALAILALFLVSGKAILAGLHLSQSALEISGGVILFLIALRMIFPPESSQADAVDPDSEPMIVPLAVPMVAGPSAMAYVILVSSQYPDRLLEWSFALVAAWAAVVVVLLAADRLSRILGPKVLTAIERLMGMILTTLAVQMLLSGVKTFMS